MLPSIPVCLAEAAPSITSIHHESPVTRHLSSHDIAARPNVTSLELHDCKIATEALPALLDAYPALESLSYISSFVYHTEYTWLPTPREIQNALIQHNPFIKKLCLDLSEKADPHPGGTWVVPENHGLDSSLTQLDQLVYLAIDNTTLAPPKDQDDSDYLFSILPVSLRYLRIIIGDNFVSPEWSREALVAMAESVPERLPSLKKLVTWDGESGEKERKEDYSDVRRAWERQGVEFLVTYRAVMNSCRPF